MHNIPTATKNLMIINVLIYLATIGLQRLDIDITSVLGLHFFLSSKFQPFQIITYMFLHANFMHILMNMFMLWMFGMVVESVWGPRRFVTYYFICGIGAALCQEVAQFAEFYHLAASQIPNFTIDQSITIAHNSEAVLALWNTVGASGAIYAILLAFGMMYPNQRMFIIPIPIPIKAKWVVFGSIALELGSAVMSSNDGIAHLAHLGGMLFGFFLFRYWQHKEQNGIGGMGFDRGRQFFNRMQNNWENRTHRTGSSFNIHRNPSPESNVRNESDWDYNARKKAQQDEIDQILDKIRKSGYDSLSKEEKRKLFDSSNNN